LVEEFTETGLGKRARKKELRKKSSEKRAQKKELRKKSANSSYYK